MYYDIVKFNEVQISLLKFNPDFKYLFVNIIELTYPNLLSSH